MIRVESIMLIIAMKNFEVCLDNSNLPFKKNVI